MKNLKTDPGFLLFLLFALIGIFTNSYYGISWDEFFMRDMGRVTYEYLFQNNNAFLTYGSRDYGMAVELPLYSLEKILGLTQLSDIFWMRHFVCHLFFLAGAYFCYATIKFIYRNNYLAAAGFLLTVLSPVIYGHSFFNSKDVPLLSMFFICFYGFARAFESRKPFHFLILAISLGILVNIRIAGFVFAASVIGFLILEFMFEKSSRKKSALNLIIVTGVFSLAAFLFWPLIWKNTFENISFVFKRMANFRTEIPVLLNGRTFQSTDLPWYYFFTSFSITTPLIYILLGIFSFILVIFQFFHSIKSYLFGQDRNTSLYFICFWVPVLLVIFLNSVMFDNWRHLYFVYAPFVMILIKGVHAFSQTGIKWAVNVALAAAFLFVAVFSLINFPHQHVYFNNLVSHEQGSLTKKFERDYWGTSYKQAIEYIMKNDRSDTVFIAFAGSSGSNNLSVLSEKYKGRAAERWYPNTDYYVGEYRYHPNGYPEFQNKKVFSISVQNSEIIAVFKLKP
jgi:hypothetical protein